MDRWFQSLAASAIAIALLYVGRSVIVPLAVAILLAIVLWPSVKRIEQLGIGRVSVGRIAAVLIVSAGVAAVFLGMAGLLATQGKTILAEVPGYRRALIAKMEDLRRPIDSLERVAHEMSAAAGVSERPAAARVEVVDGSSDLLGQISGWAGSLVSMLADAGLVLILLVFLLIEREDLRDRLIRVAGQTNIRLATTTFDDATRRVARYVRALALLNLGHGLLVGTALWLLGLPGAPLFGLLSALLRFVPYVGPWAAAALPIALSIAVFDGWGMPLAISGAFLAIELLSNNLFEPLIFGASVGLSPFGVILSAIFWACVWGPIGLVVATPLTVCLVVLGRHVPRLEGLSILLSDAEPLRPAERFYQRLLARDMGEALDIVEGYASARDLVSAWDDVVLPALSLIDRDEQIRLLEPGELERAKETVEVLFSELPETAEGLEPAAAPIECLPASSWVDEFACRAFARFLRAAGIAARARERLPSGRLLESVTDDGPSLVCIWSLDPLSSGALRHIVLRLRKRNPELRVIVGTVGNGSWRAGGLASDELVYPANGFEQAGEQVLELVRRDSTIPYG